MFSLRFHTFYNVFIYVHEFSLRFHTFWRVYMFSFSFSIFPMIGCPKRKRVVALLGVDPRGTLGEGRRGGSRVDPRGGGKG